MIGLAGCTSELVSLGETPATRAAIIAGQTIFSNQIVRVDKMVSGTDIYSENVTVTNGALLILKGSNSVVINRPFTVDSGSKIEISN